VGKGVGGTGDGVTAAVVGVAVGAFVGAEALIGVGDGFGVAARVGTDLDTGALASMVAGGAGVSMAGVGAATGDGSGVAVETVWEQPRLIAVSTATRIGVIFLQIPSVKVRHLGAMPDGPASAVCSRSSRIGPYFR